MTRRNVYSHSIDLKKLQIENDTREKFAQKLEDIEYRGYEVEDISGGKKKIVIAKPGGKKSYGRPRKEDFFVYIYTPNDRTFWQISHDQIYSDLNAKGEVDPSATVEIIDALERVYNGEDPERILSEIELKNPGGEDPETLLKAYKWIWGQEDVNYPNGLGRRMSFEGKEIEKGKEVATGEGILDLKQRLIEKIENSKQHLD